MLCQRAPAAFAQGMAVGMFNHAMEHGFGKQPDPPTPPKAGDKKLSHGDWGIVMEFDGCEWHATKNYQPKITGTGSITPVDSPIEWMIGWMKAPFMVADDIAVLGFAKIMQNSGGWNKVMSADDVIKILTKNGFEFTRQKGSHMTFTHTTGRAIIVPAHKEIAKGTLGSIKKQYFDIINPK